MRETNTTYLEKALVAFSKNVAGVGRYIRM